MSHTLKSPYKISKVKWREYLSVPQAEAYWVLGSFYVLFKNIVKEHSYMYFANVDNGLKSVRRTMDVKVAGDNSLQQ